MNVGEVKPRVKDFVIEIPINQQPKKSTRREVQCKYTVILQNNIDFVINKKTKSSDMNLVFLISQGNFYIKNNKNETVNEVTLTKLRGFFNQVSNSFPELDKVLWWNKESNVEVNFDKIVDIVNNESMQLMYRNGFLFTRTECRGYIDAVENNIKLFRYCYDKIYGSNKTFKIILLTATEIEKIINYNNAIMFIDTIADSNIDLNLESWQGDYKTFATMVTKYSLNFTRFIEYVCYDLYRQGIQIFNHNRLSDYIDYLEMQIKLYGEIKEKYPDHLATEHDIIALKYSTYKKHNQDLILLNVVENQKELLFKKGDYVITLPNSTTDIISEGIDLSHCVSSYIDRVIENKTMILFMRHKEDINKPLITIEVKDKTITQARGYANKPPTAEQDLFIKQWAKEKKLNYKKKEAF